MGTNPPYQTIHTKPHQDHQILEIDSSLQENVAAGVMTLRPSSFATAMCHVAIIVTGEGYALGVFIQIASNPRDGGAIQL